MFSVDIPREEVDYVAVFTAVNVWFDLFVGEQVQSPDCGEKWSSQRTYDSSVRR